MRNVTDVAPVTQTAVLDVTSPVDNAGSHAPTNAVKAAATVVDAGVGAKAVMAHSVIVLMQMVNPAARNL
jgi:hypothetical protein